MKVVCVGYREWALNIYAMILNKMDGVEALIQSSKKHFSEEKIRRFNPDFILFYGWSDVVAKQLISDYTCLMLHPSPLPKYRGGSPIQNQIIEGETESAVTIFIMDQFIDTGPICRQRYLSLDGSLENIFKSIEIIGFELTSDILENGLQATEQDENEATYCARRTPKMSEITMDDLKTKPASYIYNKVRMLQAPYPGAYIRSADGKKIFIRKCDIEN